MRKLWESVKRGLEAAEKPEEEIATLPEMLLITLLGAIVIICAFLIPILGGALLLTCWVL